MERGRRLSGRPFGAGTASRLLTALPRFLPVADIGLVLLSALLFRLMIANQFLFLVWVFLAPLALALKRCRATRSRARGFFLIGLFAILASVLGLWWVRLWSYWMVALCVAVISLAGALQIVNGPLSRFKALEILTPPLLWTALAFLLDLTPLGGAFADLAVFHPLAAPLISIVGSRGMTFLIVLTNWSAALSLFYRARRYFAATAALLLVPAATALYSSIATLEGKPLKVALIQGNFPQSWMWRVDNVADIIDRYERLTREAVRQKPDFVIWPEYALTTDFFRNGKIFDRVSAFAREIGTVLVLGTLTYVDEEHTDYADRRTDTMVVFSPEGRLLTRYDSARPLPLDTMTVPGVGDPIVRTDRGSFALGVCFEEYVGSAAFGADVDFLVMAVNNSQLRKTAGVELAALYSRLRAVENGKYVVRAANTGLTQVVDPFGRVAARLEPHRQGVLVFTIRI